MSPSRTVLITGGTSGLGLHCARSIAQARPDYLVVVASRTDAKSAASSINNQLGQDNVVFMPLDLGSLVNIRSFVKEWELKGYAPIQALLLNAGLHILSGLRKTVDGFEETFAVNHIGHALLFHLLLSHLADDARIVLTSSGTHDPTQKTGMPHPLYNTAEELAHPTSQSAQYPARQRYTTSKLCNVMWSYALHRRLARLPTGKITVTAMDPGLMPGTGLGRDSGPIFKFFWFKILPYILPLVRLLVLSNTHTPKASGARLAKLAVSSEVAGKSGVYFEGTKEIKSSADSYDETKQEDLWRWTVKAIAQNEEELRRFDTLNGLVKK